SEEVMKDLTSGFIKVLEECKKELNLSESIINDLYNYWKEDYSLLNRDVGCAIVCMSKKLELIDTSGKIHHGNAEDLAKKHGADSEVAAKLVAILHECEKTHDAIEDQCMKALEIAKCFRTNIHELNWAPKMDVVITEVLTEVENLYFQGHHHHHHHHHH
uniref:Pheromome Binding Protein n=1 Tax=Epiphyas postvittana TaxID=65032 RepID=UPI00178D0745|nr:Chain A, Pheromome Binding Protein [Epiphyas postvittana]6VQ5_B Chain B, Pheromome Binding Protein [Epiphyas postvittana]